ncbi:glucosaminidase domain-containing protein [Clostridium estertheticum]|uniref:glucosaminidase domain-containing protein n=1 Tax=Clostridium estertheticum TaxID=238834 RepID=UPI001CF15416|nr:glucosaminidase domain-containing protein [Clostridium estertheticum]MCB2356112.1 hypothetical protein [Clostridium estertheticum]WAG43737.1 hypothetical protein LL065_23945 [Clostridium estertheticum]
MVCRFRKYDTIEDSILDHGRLLSFTRCKSVITSKNYKEDCQNVYNSGYGTDDECPEKLIAIIERDKLYIYDCAPRFEITENTTDEDIRNCYPCGKGYFNNRMSRQITFVITSLV